MRNSEKVKLLEKLITKSQDITVRDSSDPKFKAWKNLVERTLIRIFGDASPELEHLKNLRFFYSAMIMSLGDDYSSDHRRVFDRDFEILISSIKEYIDEFKDAAEEPEAKETNFSAISKVFISHASMDAAIVEEVIELLEAIGLPPDKIFCTSLEGYGIGLGENFLDTIKDELSSESLVLFILTDNFYKSPVSMCEMGATWVLAKEHIPIVVPPLDFSDIEGVIPLTQGFKLNEPLKLNLFKEKIEAVFNISCLISLSSWERKRDRIVNRIGAKLK